MKRIQKTKVATVISLLLLTPSISYADILANEVVQLPLDENTGIQATDTSGNSNDATLQGNATWFAGKNGSALLFDGDDSHADLANDPNGQLYNLHKQDHSIAAWVKPTATLAHRSGIITRWGVHQGLFYNADQTFTFKHRIGSKTLNLNSSQAYPAGEFYHILVTIDGTNGELTLYINGQEDSKLTYAPAQSTQNFFRPWRLGVKDPNASSPAARENFAGLIDEVYFYDDVLSSTEANELWRQLGELKPLVYLKLNDNTGLTATDSSGNDNHADLYDATWVSGRNDAGLSFDGVNSYVDINNVDNSALDLLHEDNYTISAWVQPTAALGHRSGVLTRWGVHQGLFYNADKTFNFKHRTATGTKQVTTNESFEPGQFYHITVAVNGNEGNLSIYVNGRLAGSRDYDPGDHSTQGFFRPWRLGVKNIDASTPAARENFAGVLDEVQFFQGAASSTEALGLWQKQLEYCTLGDEAGTGTGNSTALLSNNDFVSFEQNDVPYEWQINKGKLAMNSERAKHGSNALEWHWVAGDSIDVSDIQNQGLDPYAIDRTNFYQSTFRLWLYNETPLENDTMRIEFYDANDELQYFYPINLNFTGWRPASVKYRTDMSGNKNSQDLTTMKIKAPASTCRGKLLIDLVDFTAPKTLIQGGDYQVPMATTGYRNHWTDMLVYETYQKGPSVTASDAQIAESVQMKATYREKALESERSRTSGITSLADAIAKYDELGIIVDGDKVTAQVPLFGPRHIHKDFGIKSDVVDSYIMVFAREYLDNNDELSKEYFLNLVRYMLDQGFAAGSMLENMSHIGYHARGINNAILLMETPLKEAGLWQQAFDAVAWYNTLEQIWQPVSDNDSNVDHARTRVGFILGVILHIDDPDKRIQYLNGYKQHLETWLTYYSRGQNGFKPDYSGFHHNTHYPGYVYGAINSITKAVDNIASSSFAISQDKLDFLIKVVKSYNVQHANRDMPISLSGRNPFSVPSLAGSLLNLANTTGDTSFYQTYNRLFLENETTQDAGKEPNPWGFWQFNYRPMGVYRDKNWVANFKGLSKYFWGSEIYKDANRFGRYQSYGSIILNYQLPDDEHSGTVTVKGSTGYTEAGWDWNKIPGTTTKHLAWADLVAAKDRQDEWNDKAFAGALRFGQQNNALLYVDHDIEGQCGIYGLDFQQRADWSPTHDGSFTFKKSMFACEGMIIALGSDINSDDSQNIIATNLFQQSLLESPQNLVENGADISGNNYSKTLTAERNWLIDMYGTGYYVKYGGDLEVRIQNQGSPSQKYNDINNLSFGDFASAWINHGEAPLNGKYEYAILPNSSKMDMFRFAMEMQMQLSYRVLQQDSDAHIVSFGRSTKEGYVIFNPSNSLAGRYVAGSDTPVLVMAEQQGTQMALSLSNPDHNFTGKAPRWGDNQPMSVTVTLKGKWSLNQPVTEVTSFGIVGENTEFTITTTDGKAYDLSLSQVE
ncbi:chondroitinase family polysaccharide lyase [Thalassotalea montiporae]